MLITEAVPAPSFSRHESFHLRYGWLKKAYNQVMQDSSIFKRDNAPIKLGVGKNMVRAIKFWGLASKILEIDSQTKHGPVISTSLGHYIFADNGLDPYIENPNTLWLLHWLLLAPPCRLPVWWLIMNRFTATNIKVNDLIDTVTNQITNISEWASPSPNSIKKDIDVFIHTYTTRRDKMSIEEYLDCPLRQIHILKQNSKDEIRFIYGEKYGLSPFVVAFACLDFIDRANIQSKSVSVSKLATEYGGVGNTFKITEHDLTKMLLETSNQTSILSVQNIAGLPHLTFKSTAKEASLKILAEMYGKKRLPHIKSLSELKVIIQ